MAVFLFIGYSSNMAWLLLILLVLLLVQLLLVLVVLIILFVVAISLHMTVALECISMRYPVDTRMGFWLRQWPSQLKMCLGYTLHFNVSFYY